jgi:transposase InsO family protein
MIIEMVNKIRKRAKTSRWGGRKLYDLLKEELHGFSIKIGRDKFFSLLRKNGLLVSPRKRKYYTTQSHHWLRKYDNLIENMLVRRINQVWVSDITYIKFNQDVFYLYLITDAYSQKIVGFYISTDLKATSAVKALQMALKNNGIKANELIHHSDRGVQYCSQEYIGILSKYEILISMAKPASPQENAIAERINGILKEEWLYDLKLKEGETPNQKIKEIIKIYNEVRPHNSLNNLTPNQIHHLGFKRHNDERVIGKTYSYKRKADKKCQPNKSNYAIVPNDYSLVSCSSAELTSASSWYCKYELNNN